MAGKKKKREKTGGSKPPYAAPRLVVHGDLRALTRSKPGTKADGTGKPATRDLGTPA